MVRAYGIDVDKDELIKALKYDRGQYIKGYAEGHSDASVYYERNFNTGIKDKNGRDICVGDKVLGIWYMQEPCIGVCKYGEEVAAYGIEWKRGEVVEFNPFACMCNIKYEVIDDEETY